MKSKFFKIFLPFVFTAMILPFVISAQSDITVTIDDIAINFPNNRPQIVHNRTLAPARETFEALGFEVEWYESAQRVTFIRDDYIIVLFIGGYYFTTNDIVHNLEVPMQIISDTAFLPLRSPLESVGYALGWNVSTMTVLISTTGELPEPTAEELEWRVYMLTNMERLSRGIDPLIWNDRLSVAARLHSEDMSENNFMSHTGSDDSSPIDRMERVNFNFARAAENVARRQRTPEEVVDAWMDSEGHRRNMLDPLLTDIGVGFSDYAWTQKFGTPR